VKYILTAPRKFILYLHINLEGNYGHSETFLMALMMNAEDSQITQLLAAHNLLKSNVAHSSYYIKMFSVVKDKWAAFDS
jgi:hypothetical protein